MKQSANGIAFYETGPAGGPPLVLIHGFPFNHAMWEPQQTALSGTRRVISYDVRGHGQSPVGDGQYDMELFVDDLIGVMDHLKIRRTVLCGLSMGGYIALRAVQRHPDRFTALVLCDTKSEADGDEAKIGRMTAAHAVKKDGVEPFAAEFVKKVLSEETLQKKPELVRSVLALIRGNQPAGLAGALLAMAARTDTTAALPKMALPVLVLVGEHDKLTPPSVAESMRQALPNAAMAVIPNAAHLSNLENPSVFNEKLLDFLKKS